MDADKAIFECDKPTFEALAEVAAERVRQDRRFGNPLKDRTGPYRMIAVLGEEFGEACQAFLAQKSTDKEDPRAELIQVAAVAVKMIEMGDAHDWWHKK